MNCKKIWVVFFWLVVLSGGSVFAIPAVKTPYLYSPRQAGLGNAVTALPDDEFLLFNNPAGLGLEGKYLKSEPDSIFYFNFASAGFSDLIKIIDFYQSIKNENFTGDSIRIIETLEKSVDAEGYSFKGSTLAVSYLSEFWGITFLPIVDLKKATILVDLLPSMHVNLATSIQFSVGFKPVDIAFDEYQNFSFGLAFRPFYMFQMQKSLNVGNFKSLSEGSFQVSEGLGFALDLGLLYEVVLDSGHRFNVGLAVSDAPGVYFPVVSKITKVRSSTDGTSFLQVNPKLGFAYILPNYLDSFFSKTSVSIDYHRWIDPYQTFGTKIHIGLGTTVIDFPSFKLGLNGGVNGGYFTSSIAMYFFGMRLDYSFYQEELAYASGGNSFSRHELGFSLYF